MTENIFDKTIEAIINKTKNKIIQWDRIDQNYINRNSFYKKYILDNFVNVDGINQYVASFTNGNIFFSKDSESGYCEVAIQPGPKAAIMPIKSGNSGALRILEEEIKEKIDNPDDFINKLLEE